ncbi:replication restart helicase PriA [Aeoliella mucimassa]|uniref:Replication restart protein PriA n=1 Tax=Aeoliella mucimassa TaxID=2527972 RepID=A0A518AID4_9BACT|nr:primosomal protein N' [Aeoliella mucimassa]QDU54424.1 Primosomal protein N' [Aeoliella mucimassa]
MAQQQNLFDTTPPAWELDDAETKLVARVVLSTGPTGEFDYLVPENFADERRPEMLVEAGRRVQVPLGRGNRPVVAYCTQVGLEPVAGRRLKLLAAVLDTSPLLTPRMLELGRWIAEYYLTPLGQVLEGILPAGVRGKAGTRETTLFSVPTRVSANFTRLDLPEKQAKALMVLAASSKPLAMKQWMARAECTAAPINALRKKELVESRVERIDTDPLLEEEVERRAPHELNTEQAAALHTIADALESREQQTLLLHGVTGSGKTEVYIQAIEKVVSYGRQAIVLVPEISLTPQTVGRFRERFDNVAVLHSHQSDVERHRQWKRIAAGGVQVVVGARSAIFAPTPHLGLVVIDEEHETSFKQDTAPRYHARQVAIQRTKMDRVPLILGSATPSLETWHAAKAGEYRLVTLENRVSDLPLPTVRAVDLRDMDHRHNRGAISRPLYQAMGVALNDGGQVILMLNRRGYSTHVQCPSCGFALKCPQCDVSMVYHRAANQVTCHWCDYTELPPTYCPECKDANIRYGGLGTQKLEAEVRARFPKARVLRMDTDSMRRPGSHEQALDSFRAGEVDILLGTQMIAKGLDFPNVTLVGVINADTALHWPDFRASERTFHLVTQVAGRTGRGDRGGRVLVQTLSPDHPAIVAAMQHNYRMFADNELPDREMLGYPPFGRMARVVVRGKNEEVAQAVASGFAEQMQATESGGSVIGPAPCAIAKLREYYRFHLLIKAGSIEQLHATLAPLAGKLKLPDDVQWIADIDPIDMM